MQHVSYLLFIFCSTGYTYTWVTYYLVARSNEVVSNWQAYSNLVTGLRAGSFSISLPSGSSCHADYNSLESKELTHIISV